MRAYVHGEGHDNLTVHDVDLDSVVADIVGGDTLFVFVQGGKEPVDAGSSLGSLAGGADHVHLHRHRCRQIEVAVRYNQATISEDVPPGRTLEKVLRWAVGRHEFGLDPASATDLTLRLPGSDRDLDLDTGVEAYTAQGTCSVTFDLLPAHRFAG